MSDTNQTPARSPLSPVKKVGLGLAIIGLPVAAAVTTWELKKSQDKSNDELERGFKYDDSAMRQVDPKLIGYHEVGQITTGMEKPSCFSVGLDGKIYVAGDRLAKVLDAKGKELLSFSISGEATCIAASPTGDIYIGMEEHLEVYTPEGKLKSSWESLGAGSHISSLAVSAKAVYVADSGSRVGHVYVYDLQGNQTSELAKESGKAGIPGLITPSPHMDVAVNADGNIWVANPGRHQLELYSPTGDLLQTFGQSGTNVEQFVGCCNPSDFTLLADGRIVTAEKGIARVKTYNPDGHLVSVVATPDSFTGNRQGLDLATNDAGQVLVLEPGTRSIRIFGEKS